MPSVSKKQHNYMAGVMSGSIQSDSLTPEQAAEFVHADKGRVKNLPEKKGDPKKKHQAARRAQIRKK